MLCETVYAYGTTIRVWYRKTYHTRMVRTVRVRYVPYAYGMKYAYGTQQPRLSNAGGSVYVQLEKHVACDSVV